MRQWTICLGLRRALIVSELRCAEFSWSEAPWSLSRTPAATTPCPYPQTRFHIAVLKLKSLLKQCRKDGYVGDRPDSCAFACYMRICEEE
jgi:hypothetical protein